MNYLSVCSGIEAASVAWRPLGWHATAFAELDAFPSAVLSHHYPDVPNVGDMTKLIDLIRQGKLPAPDILVGGTPCQAFSVAGKRESLNDERGQLTLAFVEIANAIDAVRSVRGEPPCIIVWENVPGVLNTQDNAFGCFLAGLSGTDAPLLAPTKTGKWTNAGCVFGPQRAIAWRILDAQYFGVAQRRRRVFLIASARKGFNPSTVLFESEGMRRDTPPSRQTSQEPAPNVISGTTPGSQPACYEIGPSGAKLSPVSPTLDRGCKNGPMQNQVGLGIVSTARMVAFGEYTEDDTASTIKARDYKDATDLVVTAIHGTQDPCVLNDLAHTLGRNNGQENALVYGIPGNWIGRAPENGGNAVTPMINVSPCLTKTDRHGVVYSTSQVNQTVISDDYEFSVRRLTPIECERLQGFPDNYTHVLFEGKLACDSKRYATLGNSMAVPVMHWIGKRIKHYANSP